MSSGVRSRAEEEFWLQLVGQEGIPLPERQYRFCKRKWAFDFAWPAGSHSTVDCFDCLRPEGIALEVEGGVHRIKGRFTRDVEKYNEAALLGWVVLRATPEMVRNGEALKLLERSLGVTSKPRESVHASELV